VYALPRGTNESEGVLTSIGGGPAASDNIGSYGVKLETLADAGTDYAYLDDSHALYRVMEVTNSR
jgi:hypothetical protein